MSSACASRLLPILAWRSGLPTANGRGSASASNRYRPTLPMTEWASSATAKSRIRLRVTSETGSSFPASNAAMASASF